jgi:hypothetical protein
MPAPVFSQLSPELSSSESGVTCDVNFAYKEEELLHKYTLQKVISRAVTDEDHSVMRAVQASLSILRQLQVMRWAKQREIRCATIIVPQREVR